MSRREDIDNAVWSDPEFHGLSPNAKLVYLWSFTNPRCGMAGLYKVVLGAIALETGLAGADVSAALEELRQERFVFYDKGVLWVRTRVKHLRTKTPNIAKSIARDVESISGPLRDQFLAEYRSLGWLADPLQTLGRGSTDPHQEVREQAENVDPSTTVGRGSPDPPGNGQGKGVEKNGPSRTREAADLAAAQDRLKEQADELPDELPENLHAAARQVQARLLELHRRKPGSLYPPLAAVGRTLASHPDRPHVDVAEDVEHYWSFGPGQARRCKDLVATYRNRLKTAPIVEAGTAAGPAPFDAVVAAAERRERELQARRAKAGVS